MTKLGVMDTIMKLDGTSPIPVASTATVYTPHFPLHGADAFGVSILLAGAGDQKVTMELEEGMEEPENDEAQSDNFVIPDGFPTVFDVEDTNLHIKQLTPIPARYGRFKITGKTGNNAATTALIKLFRQEESV